MDDSSDNTLDEENWTRVGSYQDLRSAQDHALVVLAMGLPCWIEVFADRPDHDLLVNPESSERVLMELREYDAEMQEQLARPVMELGSFAHSPGWGAYFLWLLVLIMAHRLQIQHPILVELGASSSLELIEGNQWWRPFTALFFHADVEHLLGNLLSGLFFTTLVASSLGAWRGWLLILTCGTLGNATTCILVYPAAYQSIGASTAVFAALGILSGVGVAWMLRFRTQIPWLRVIAPILGGIIVLGMTGSGAPDGNTDIMGHVFGFVFGVIAGALAGSLSEAISCRANCGTSKAESDALT